MVISLFFINARQKVQTDLFKRLQHFQVGKKAWGEIDKINVL